jgi:hypothetical protein
MDCVKHYADVETPVPAATWTALDERQRVDQIVGKLAVGPAQFLSQIEITTALADGQVIVLIKQSMSANQRGTLLLDLEASLKETIDAALTVWLEPVGDRNSLRNLRGIEVKAS